MRNDDQRVHGENSCWQIETHGQWLYTFSKLLLVYSDVKQPEMKEPAPPAKRVRLSREQGGASLIDIAWHLVRQEGTDALTLPRLSQEAAVAKPVVYDHFGTRNGLLIALYRDFDSAADGHDRRRTARGAARRSKIEPAVIATSYVDCVLAQGREMPGVLAALAGSPSWRR
jgi:AcrR family transcriptional regulator